MANLITTVEPVEFLRERDIKQMYELMQFSYDGVGWEVFQRDLKRKCKVLLGRDGQGDIQGFSTIETKHFEVGGRSVAGLFSGDTILTKEHWASISFVTGFFSYLMTFKTENPEHDAYWFLISKGPKTYTFMANNFPIHYPRFETPMPQNFKEVMDVYYGKKYGTDYDFTSGIIRPRLTESYALRRDLGAATAEHDFQPRLAYFLEKNPDWLKGDELACIARIDLDLPAFRLLKRRSLSRPTQQP